jgi:hypothetical protein
MAAHLLKDRESELFNLFEIIIDLKLNDINMYVSDVEDTGLTIV